MTVGRMAYMNFAYNSLSTNSLSAIKSLQKISSGYRINSAADDAAGLAVSERMRGQISGMGMAYNNAMQGISMVQTAEGNLDTTSDIIVRMKELAVQASNATYTDEQRTNLNKEFMSLKSEMDRIAGSTHYNGQKLLDGTLGGKKGTAGLRDLGVSGITVGGKKAASGDAKFTISKGEDGLSITAQIGGETVTNNITDLSATSTVFTLKNGTEVQMDFSTSANALKEGTIAGVKMYSGMSYADTYSAVSADSNAKITFQVGANGTEDQRISMSTKDMSSFGLGLVDADISTEEGANAALKALEGATQKTISQRSSLGATQNRLEHTLNNLSNTKLNLTQAESSIRDTDIAKEIMNYTQKNIMTQAAHAMMAQGMNLSQQTMMGLLAMR